MCRSKIGEGGLRRTFSINHICHQERGRASNYGGILAPHPLCPFPDPFPGTDVGDANFR